MDSTNKLESQSEIGEFSENLLVKEHKSNTEIIEILVEEGVPAIAAETLVGELFAKKAEVERQIHDYINKTKKSATTGAIITVSGLAFLVLTVLIYQNKIAYALTVATIFGGLAQYQNGTKNIKKAKRHLQCNPLNPLDLSKETVDTKIGFDKDLDKANEGMEAYCTQCNHYDSNLGVCSSIHANVKSYPIKFAKKCGGKYFSERS